MSDIFLIFIPHPITCSPLLEKIKKTQHKTNTKKEEENPNQFCTNASIAMF